MWMNLSFKFLDVVYLWLLIMSFPIFFFKFVQYSLMEIPMKPLEFSFICYSIDINRLYLECAVYNLAVPYTTSERNDLTKKPLCSTWLISCTCDKFKLAQKGSDFIKRICLLVKHHCVAGIVNKRSGMFSDRCISEACIFSCPF